MPMYLRHTRLVQLEELPAHIRSKLADHAESRRIELNGVRAWLTHSARKPLQRNAFQRCSRRSPRPRTQRAESATVLVNRELAAFHR